MHQDAASLAALIGSRICHDLISPIGAISNGLELVGMTDATPSGPEMSLIQQSCDNATARIRFFRIAFGTAADARDIAVTEARKTLVNHYAGTRISAEWHSTQDFGRDITQLAYLAALCLEAALPQGGVIRLELSKEAIVGTAQGRQIRRDQPVWCLFAESKTEASPDIIPAHVQFPLLAQLCTDRKCPVSLRTTNDTARLQIDLHPDAM